MLAISEVIYAKRNKLNWILFDIYKIASDFPINVSVFGAINGIEQVQLLMAATTGSRRRNLQGLIIPCGLAVNNILFSLARINILKIWSVDFAFLTKPFIYSTRHPSCFLKTTIPLRITLIL